MPPDEMITQSWGNRIMESIKGVLFGAALFVASFFLLGWNESRAVTAYRNLNEVRDTVVTVSADAVSQANTGKPIFVSGETSTGAVLKDPRFDIEVNAIALRRRVEMYQWKEETESRTEKQTGGGTKKSVYYSYEKVWSDQVIPSAGFHQQAGHENPVILPFESWQDRADQVNLGSFRFSSTLIPRLNFFEPISPRDAALPEGVNVDGTQLYLGTSSSAPEIGDVRIRFEVVNPGPVSVIAGQEGSTLTSWVTSNGTAYSRIQKGNPSLEEMLAAARREAKILTWILRGAGWLIMTIGISMVLRPISVVADVLPILGNIAETGIGLVAGLIALTLSLITIAVAWIVVRPLVGIPLLLLAAGLVVLHVVRQRKLRGLRIPYAETDPS
jgi:hypothetical protein